jgi:hypothetical protein
MTIVSRDERFFIAVIAVICFAFGDLQWRCCDVIIISEPIADAGIPAYANPFEFISMPHIETMLRCMVMILSPPLIVKKKKTTTTGA